MRIIGRPAPLLAALLVAVLSLAGCGSSPREANAAAIVGERTVAVDAVQQEISWLLRNIPEAKDLATQRKLAQVSQYVVRQQVIHELVELAARREGLKLDHSEVDELIDSWGGPEDAPKAIGVSPGALRPFARDQVLLRALGAKYAETLAIDVVGTVVAGEAVGATAKTKALELGEKIAADPTRAKELATATGGQVLDQRLVLHEMLEGNLATLSGTALFGVPAGTVVVIQPNPEQGAAWLVALVREREVATRKREGTHPPHIEPQQLEAIGLQSLGPIAQDIGVRISPRYGVWDQAGMRVAQSDEHVTGYLIPARADRS